MKATFLFGYLLGTLLCCPQTVAQQGRERDPISAEKLVPLSADDENRFTPLVDRLIERRLNKVADELMQPDKRGQVVAGSIFAGAILYVVKAAVSAIITAILVSVLVALLWHYWWLVAIAFGGWLGMTYFVAQFAALRAVKKC